ncbi:unnamed protein product [Rotaria sp. Silwood1]|nr:unnamed protein product [Rotaria sp. Silwood1]
MFTNGLTLTKIDDENYLKPHKTGHHNGSDSDELMKAVDKDRQDNEDFHKVLRKRLAFTSDQIEFQNAVLAAHNSYRARHCAQPLQLDDVLSRSAQNFSEKLASTNKFYRSGTPGVGENLYMEGGSTNIKLNGTAPVTFWYNEIKYYNFNSGSSSMPTGDFTQLVWKSTTRLGVGIAYSNGGRPVYVVAHYSPPGNYMGQYTANVLPEGSC